MHAGNVLHGQIYNAWRHNGIWTQNSTSFTGEPHKYVKELKKSVCATFIHPGISLFNIILEGQYPDFYCKASSICWRKTLHFFHIFHVFLRLAIWQCTSLLQYFAYCKSLATSLKECNKRQPKVDFFDNLECHCNGSKARILTTTCDRLRKRPDQGLRRCGFSLSLFKNSGKFAL